MSTPPKTSADEVASEALRDAQAQSELRDYIAAKAERRRVFPKAIAVGIAAGLLGVAFRAALTAGDSARIRMIEAARQLPPFGELIPILVCSMCAALAVLVVRVWAPEAAGSGVAHIKLVLRKQRTLRWARVIIAKFVGGIFALGGGMAMGPEGPMVQMGGASGMAVAKLFKAGTSERFVMIAAGAGAGLTAAYNAPLAGLVYVVEEIRRDFRPAVFGAAFLACAISDVMVQLLTGNRMIFSPPALPAQAVPMLPLFALLGVAAGALGVAFNKGLLRGLNLLGSKSIKKSVAVAAVVGAVVGLISYVDPNLTGGGERIANLAMASKLGFAYLPLYFSVRFVLTIACSGTGAPGGIYSPSLGLGALLGLGFGFLGSTLAPHSHIALGAFAVVGMAAYFTAVFRAPLTGIVLIVEMTSSYSQMLALLVACFCAYAVAELLNDMPNSEAMVQRDLRMGGESPTSTEPAIVEFEVMPGSPFEGKLIRDLGLPSGVVFVECTDGDREWVPTADTVLHAHLKLAALISPSARDGHETLQRGCAADDGDSVDGDRKRVGPSEKA